MRSESEQVGQISYLWKRRAAKELDQRRTLVLREIEFDVLYEARKIGDHQYLLALIRADERQHVRVFRAQKLHRSAPECFVLFAQRDHAAHPPEQRMAIAFVRVNVGALVVVLGVDDHGQDQTLWVSR